VREQELKRKQEAADEKESAKFTEALEIRSRDPEQGSTMLVSNEGLDRLQNRNS
jgi:hypothetical protein